MDLYRIDDIALADSERTAVCVVGSRHQADLLWWLGKPATTYAAGWQHEWTPRLTGRHIVFLPGRNEVQWALTQDAVLQLAGAARTIRWVLLPVRAPLGLDDWLAGGGTLALLTQLVRRTPLLVKRTEWNENEFQRVWSIHLPKKS